MDTRINTSELNISYTNMLSYDTEYESIMLFNDDDIDPNCKATTDCVIATFITRLDVSANIPSLICLVDEQIYPIAFTSFNRKLIKKLFGSVTKFLHSMPEVLVKSGLLKGCNVTYVKGSLGIYRGVVDELNSKVTLYRDKDIVISYSVIGISDDIYRGTEFRFVRYVGVKQLENVNLINSLSDEDFVEYIKQDNSEFQKTDTEVAILAPIKRRRYQSNRKLRKLGKSKFANRSLTQCFKMYRHHPRCRDVKISLSDIYAEKYTESKKENNL